MTNRISRRRALGYLGTAGAALFVPAGRVRAQPLRITVAGRPADVGLTATSNIVRVSVWPADGSPRSIPDTGALAVGPFDRGLSLSSAGVPATKETIVRFTPDPPTIHIERIAPRDKPQVIQRLTFDPAAPGLSFLLPQGPLLGLGEGGVQFDRRGATDQMRNGQVTADADGYRLAIHGTRAPIQWLVGTGGWGMFIHQPYGAFDFKGTEGRFTPRPETPLPFEIFVVTTSDPLEIMKAYATLTGFPEMPPLWAFGYQQSSRTLGGAEEILAVARTFREKRLPCDTLIYLGTEFAPSGWNTRNGEFTWHPTNFPNPKKMMDALHAQHFRTVVHVVIEGRQLTGRVSDPCTADPLPSGRTPDDRWPPVRQVSCYWPAHKAVLETGVDGWWPDQGDGFDGPSRFNRHRMYWEGTQLYRPNERPFALHRNASAGVQRFGGFIWSGDVQSRWDTLRTHVPVAINTGLSGLPYWGTDIGGFNPTTEYTAELHVRWFQFGAFNPLFRAHGRNWHLRLPWGWDGGDGGPFESGQWRADPAELKRPEVETICRKYLELRYRLMPYLHTAMRECHDTGLPIIRALWLHYPDDPAAVARGDEYLWGRDILVAPVVEKGATSRKVYLPRGDWIDFWTEERVAGGREIERAVDLATMPLYVRAGAVIPFGPVRQYVDEQVDAPVTLVTYPGADGSSVWYKDDGRSFAYRNGEWMKVIMGWQDRSRRLSLRLSPGAKMLQPVRRDIVVRIAGDTKTKPLTFDGRPVQIGV